MVTSSTAGTHDETTVNIDAFYNALGWDDSGPHPMDEVATALLFAKLQQQRAAKQ